MLYKVIHWLHNCSDNKTAAVSGMLTCNMYGLFAFSTFQMELEALLFKVAGAVLCSGLGALTGLMVKHYFDKYIKK